MDNDGELQVGDPQASGFQSTGHSARRQLLVQAGLPLLAGVILLVLSSVIHASNQSSYVQQHGVRRTAVIESVHNTTQGSGQGYWTGTGSNRHWVPPNASQSAEVIVRLASPAGGRTQTTVHVPNYEDAAPGTALTVLVDPQDPGYAELPGSPRTAPFITTALQDAGGVLLVFAVLAAVRVVRARRREARGAAVRS